MVLTAILRKAGPDRYFLDEAQWATKRRLGGGKLLRIGVVFGLALIALAIFAVGK